MLNNLNMRRYAAIACVGLLGLAFSGCQSRYGASRVYDFCDIFQAGVGVTSENPKTGVIPPSGLFNVLPLGVHVQATEFLNLGAVQYTGRTAEWDGRGFFYGKESRERFGLGPLQILRIDQDYKNGYENYFKKVDGAWTTRMNTEAMRWRKTPAKELEYEYWSDQLHIGAPIMPRGWQYWENLGIEIGVAEPFFSHLGASLRLGFDPSEISDFVLGFFTVDFKSDDLTDDEFAVLAPPESISMEPKPASVETAPMQEVSFVVEEPPTVPIAELPPVSPSSDIDVEVTGKGIEFQMGDNVLFHTGSANLTDRGRSILDDLAASLKSQYAGRTLNIEGHTDTQPITHSKWKSNWELGAARALTVLHYLVDQHGFTQSNLSATTYGEFQPKVPNTTAENMSRNRRAVVVVPQ